jgi:hypothetical protein
MNNCDRWPTYKGDQLHKFYCNLVLVVHVYVLASLLIRRSLRNKKSLTGLHVDSSVRLFLLLPAA